MEKKERNSNLELYRIIMMLLIIMHHYVVNSGLIQYIEKDTWSGNSVFFYIFGMWGRTAIDCFVLITGYFMCKSNITIRKFLKLLLQIELYAIFIYVLFVISGRQPFSIVEFCKNAWPFYGIKDNFSSCFLMFYLFIPFLKILIHGMNKRQHQLLIALCLFLYTGLGSIPNKFVWMNYTSWFCVLYIMSSYIRMFPQYHDSDTKFWGFATLSSVFISIVSVVLVLYLKSKMSIDIHPYFLVIEPNKVLAVLTSVCCFNFFRNLKISYSRIINTIASTTFGILLIHAHSDTMRNWLWRDVLDVVGQQSTNHTYLLAILSVLGVFIICSIIDYFRISFIEKYYMQLVDKFIKNRI